MSAVTIHNLYLEWAYLLSLLQQEDQRATNMLKRIQFVQQDHDIPFDDTNNHQIGDGRESGSVEQANSRPGFLTRPSPQVHKSKLTRQLNHLKNRLVETTKQEMCILARLEQVTGEILNHGKWEAEQEEIWGFADAINLHSYGWKSGTVEASNVLDGSRLVVSTTMTDNNCGIETPTSGVSPRVSPRTQTPVESAVPTSTKKGFDPRSPSFRPRMPLPKCRQHSLIEWAEPQYSHIIDEVKYEQAQRNKNESGVPLPFFFIPTKVRHSSSMIDWSELQYKHMFEEVRQAQEQRIHKMEIQATKRVQIHMASERRSMQASIAELDSQVSQESTSSPHFSTSTSTETGTTISTSETQTSTPPNRLCVDKKEQQHTRKASLHENYLIGLAKIRAASVAHRQTFKDLDESFGSNEEDEKRDAVPITRSSWSAGGSTLHR